MAASLYSGQFLIAALMASARCSGVWLLPPFPFLPTFTGSPLDPPPSDGAGALDGDGDGDGDGGDCSSIPPSMFSGVFGVELMLGALPEALLGPSCEAAFDHRALAACAAFSDALVRSL